MALTAPTDFVWVVDDDIIPGNKYLAQLIHAAGTELMGNSLLGSIGRVLPRPGRDMSLVSYRKVSRVSSENVLFRLSLLCRPCGCFDAELVTSILGCRQPKWYKCVVYRFWSFCCCRC